MIVPAPGRDSMADDSHQVEQDEIEQLLRQAQAAGGSPMSAAPPTPPPKPKLPASSGDAGVSQDDIELLLRKAEQALASIDEPSESLPSGVQSFRFQDFSGAPPT